MLSEMFFLGVVCSGKAGLNLCAKVAHCVTPAKGCEENAKILN